MAARKTTGPTARTNLERIEQLEELVEQLSCDIKTVAHALAGHLQDAPENPRPLNLANQATALNELRARLQARQTRSNAAQPATPSDFKAENQAREWIVEQAEAGLTLQRDEAWAKCVGLFGHITSHGFRYRVWGPVAPDRWKEPGPKTREPLP